MNSLKQFERVAPLFILLICSFVFSPKILAQDIVVDKQWPDFVYSKGAGFIATNTRITIAERSTVADDSDFDWEEEKTVETSGPDVPIYPGAKSFDPGDTMYLSGFFSDQSYLLEDLVETVKLFYLELDGKFCSIDDESPMAFEEGELMMTSILCLNHSGETKAGDKVTVITIFKAPAPILSDLIGRKQGDWTIFSINSWVEEDY